MAENDENVQNLDQDGETGVTPQTDDGNAPSEETQAVQPEESGDKPLEEMSLEELEAKIQTGDAEQKADGDRQQTDSSQTPEKPTTPPALLQPDSPETSHKAQSRWQQLANSNRAKDEEIAALRAQIQSLQTRNLNIPAPPWETDPTASAKPLPLPEVKPGMEITPEIYNQHVQAQAQAIAQGHIQAAKLQMEAQAARQEQARSLNEAVSYIRQAYPELDPNSRQYSRELDEKVGTLIEGTINNNPAALRKQVDAIMGMRAATLNTERQHQEISKQAAQSALIPGSSIEEKPIDYNALTLEQIEKMAGTDGE